MKALNTSTSIAKTRHISHKRFRRALSLKKSVSDWASGCLLLENPENILFSSGLILKNIINMIPAIPKTNTSFKITDTIPTLVNTLIEL